MPDPTRRGAVKIIRAVTVRALMFALLWLVLTEGAVRGLVPAVAAIILAAIASVVLVPPRTAMLRPRALLGFIPYFLSQSFRGGVDVALRAFDPALPLRPAIVVVPTSLPVGLPPVALACAASLFPGTLVTRITGDSLHVHVLDEDADIARSIGELERRIAAMLV